VAGFARSPAEQSTYPAAVAASKMLLGLATPSPLPSLPQYVHDPGRNPIGPMPASYCEFPSHLPPSVSRITAVPGIEPSSSGPMIWPRVLPFASRRPPKACPVSMRPMLATSHQVRWQDGLAAASIASAFL
jgi:hypothetical protein